MDLVHNFDKTMQQRLEEYMDILNGVQASALDKTWGFYLELAIDPSGWRAVWKISRAICQTLEIPFPVIVLVSVLKVDFPSLHALVKIIAVQDDIHIPDKYYVPLIQLWPTKLQDNNVSLNLPSTANAIDMLRFFYLNLFMPWDLDDDDTDWKSKHLESRLRLNYDIKDGAIPKAISYKMNSLLTEARELQNQRELIEFPLQDTDVCEIFKQEHIERLTDIQLRLLEIRNKVEILENPLLRKSFIKKQQPNFISKNTSLEPKIWLVQESVAVENYIKFLQKVNLLHPNDKVNVQPDLSFTLENGGPNDIFILSKGNYSINVVGALEGGGTLKGIEDANSTTLASAVEDMMFDFQGNKTLIENVTINSNESQTAAVIRKGKVIFSNCKIIGNGLSTIRQGIIVLAGSELELKNCEIYGFDTAIVANSGSHIIMENTSIHDVNFGLKIYDNSMVKATQCSLRDCNDFAICVETERNIEGDKHEVGNFDLLDNIPEIIAECVSGSNNKGDVIINHTPQVEVIEALFSNDDPEVSEGASEDDMQADEGNKDENEMEITIEDLKNATPETV